MATIDEKQAATADWLVRQVRSGPSDRTAVWNITGAVGSGKTTVLRLVQESLRREGLIPLMVAAPAGEVDGAVQGGPHDTAKPRCVRFTDGNR